MASAIFGRLHGRVGAPGGGGAPRGGALSAAARVEDLEGRRLSAGAALDAAAGPLQSLADALEARLPGGGGRGGGGAAGGGAIVRAHCDALLRLCHLQLQRVVYAQREGGPGRAEVLSAKATARRCMSRLQGSAECEPQLRELARLLGQQEE